MYPLHGDLTRSSCQPPAWMATPYLPGRVKDLRLGPRASMRSLRRARDRSSPSECWATSPTAPCAPKTQPAGVDSYEPGLWGNLLLLFYPFIKEFVWQSLGVSFLKPSGRVSFSLLCDPSALWPMLQKMLSFYHRSFPHSLQSSLEDSEGPSDGLVTNYFLTSLPFDTVGNLVR